MAIVCGEHFTLFLNDEGEVWKLGMIDTTGYDTELAIMSAELRKIPLVVSVQSVACGLSHCLILDTFGDVWGIGDGSNGELGLGNFESSSITPVHISSLCNILSIACGYHQSFCINSNYRVLAFGHNSHGELGIGTWKYRETTPTIIPGIPDIKSIASGDAHSGFLTFENDLFMCGRNHRGQLGLGSQVEQTYTPKKIPDIKITSIACGKNHTLVTTLSGKVYSFGANGSGQLGIGDYTKRHTPVHVPICKGVVIKKIYCGSNHSYLLDDIGNFWVFGSNKYGELGIGEHSGMQSLPSKLTSISRISIVSQSCHLHTLIKTERDILFGFGRNTYGQLAQVPEIIYTPSKLKNEYASYVGRPKYYSAAKSARK